MRYLLPIMLLCAMTSCKNMGWGTKERAFWESPPSAAEQKESWWGNYYNREEKSPECSFYGNCGDQKSSACSFYGNCGDSKKRDREVTSGYWGESHDSSVGGFYD